VKTLSRSVHFLAALAVLLAPAVAGAQTPKPVVVLSISGVDELLGDVDYLTKAAGAEDYGNLFKLLAAPYTVGIDKTKPWGVVLQSDGDEFLPLGFVPVKDLKGVFGALREQIGEPRDVGGGVFELTDPAPMYIKEANGFAFIAAESKFLETLPDDPVKLLGGLNTEYDIAVRAYAQNIPQAQKDWAIEQIKEQNRQALENQLQGLDEDDPQYKLAKRLSENQLARLVDMINDTEEATIGWSTDGMAKKTYLDISLVAKQGTPTAKRMDLLKGNETAHAGFALPGAAMTLAITSRMDKDDIDQVAALLDTVKAKAFEEIDTDGDLDTDSKKAQAKEVIGGLIDVLMKTCESGKLDGGAAVVLEPKQMTLVAGGQIADPKGLETALRKLVELAKDEPDFPEVKFDAETYKGIVFHTVSVPVPASEEEARQVLGENLDVVVGIGNSAAFLSLGHDAGGMLKKVIDASSMKKADAPPMNLNIALTPIFKFAASVQENPVLELIGGTLEKSEGADNISLTSTPSENGVLYRLSIEEGVLQAIGEAIKFRQGGI
jgi:hypothetical protein